MSRITHGFALGLILTTMTPALQAGAEDVKFSTLPKLQSGAPAYPPPFMAIAKTPGTLPVEASRFVVAPSNYSPFYGYMAGFGGFVDMATGQFGYPGMIPITPLSLAFDDEKLVVQVFIGQPYGRSFRLGVTDPVGDISKDDVFEFLVAPLDRSSRLRGKVFRVMGNAAGICVVNQDDPSVGQYRLPWPQNIKYGIAIEGALWKAVIQIPFKDLGGAPVDGDIWGVQMAIRYADPKIVAVLSPMDSDQRMTEDWKRFARIRFDYQRQANYLCHFFLDPRSIDGRVPVLFNNGGNAVAPMETVMRIFKGDNEISKASVTTEVPPLSRYFEGKETHHGYSPATAAEKSSYVRVTTTDLKSNQVVYDQMVPYWQAPPDERNWLKEYFAKEFVLLIGPYPSKGVFDVQVNCKTLMEANPSAASLRLATASGGKELDTKTVPLPGTGLVDETLSTGPMADGATYEVVATILDKAGQPIGSKKETFTRRVMEFEKAPKAGLSDIVVPPFTPPVIKGSTVSCWARTYKHGKDGLLTGLLAADKELLAGTARFFVTAGDGQTVILSGRKPSLKPRGKGRVDYAQTFAGGGITLKLTGEFDYDGFYRFTASFAPEKEPVQLKELRLEIPVKGEFATLIEAPVEWMWKDWEKCVGFLGKQEGRLWDSKTFPVNPQIRKSNMPPYIWFGDDERGLCFSCPSDQGTFNDDKLPAVALDRQGAEVVLKVWAVNQPLKLEKGRSFAFALQASPYKPMLDNFRLWRSTSRNGGLGTYPKHGVFFTSGWGLGSYYPTYGRFLNLALNKKILDEAKKNLDVISASGSALSECGGTPEYLQFWREWGSALGWDKQLLSPVPDWAKTLFKDAGDIPCSPYVMVESFATMSAANADFRIWWLNEVVAKCGVGAMYQDNPPYLYNFQPVAGYGYVRDDGAKEPTCATWNQRTFMKRVAHVMVENGVTNSPYTYPNLCGNAQPGRSFCRKGLTGETPASDKLTLGQMRVWLSKQWGIQVDWLMQEPNAGAPYTYWRALCSRLFLLDVTDFSRGDSADVAMRWLHALDAFWLDDPTVVWHPYYKTDLVKSTARATTLISAYTGKGRALFVISNQSTNDGVEAVAFQNLDQYGAGGLQYFYDAETGGEIELAGGALKLFIPGDDYRLVLGFPAPWPFAAKNALGKPDLPPASAVDPRPTVTALVRQLQSGLDLKPVANGNALTEAWINGIIAEIKTDMSSNPASVVYYDAKACADIDLGDKAVKVAVIHHKVKGYRLVMYDNSSDRNILLTAAMRQKVEAKLGVKDQTYVIDPVEGYSFWSLIDLPANSGKLELSAPYWQPGEYEMRRGPLKVGTMTTRILQAVQAQKEGK